MLLTQDGLHALADFTLCAAPLYDVDGARVEGNDGLMLTCKQQHEGKTRWQWQWPGHVAAPTLRDLALVAQEHWWREHPAVQPVSAEAEASAA
jgi:hypothetical protein